MKKVFFLLFLLTFSNVTIFAQKAKTIKGEAQVEWDEENESKKQAKERAKDAATIKALQDAFGTAVVQGNATYMKNRDSGELSETTSVFNSIGSTLVKGEVLEILDEEYKEFREKGRVPEIRCNIKLKARELVSIKPEYEAFALSGNTKNNKTEHFYNGQDFFFYFNTPVSGYLSLYIDVNGLTERILPYQTVPSKYESGFPVEADKGYVFFSPDKEHAYFEEDGVQTDEIYLSLDTGNEQELWRLFVIFTKDPLDKPKLSGKEKGRLTEAEIMKNITVPKSLPSEDFTRWKIKNQQVREDMQVQIIDIKITRD